MNDVELTYEEVAKLAKACRTLEEFFVYERRAYDVARMNRWLQAVCSHMGIKPKARRGLAPLGRYSNENPARKKRRPVGAIKLTFEEVSELASRCRSRSEFAALFPSAYNMARAQKWYAAVCAHMEYLPTGRASRHSRESAIEQMAKFSNLSGFRKNNKSLYYWSRRQDWWPELLASTFPPLNKERCAEIAKNFRSRTEFSKIASAEYYFAKKNGWLDEICDYGNPNVKFTLEIVRKIAAKFESRTRFSNGERAAYQSAQRNGWLDQVCAHMECQRRKSNYTIESVKQAASKYRTRTQFANGERSAYRAALRHGWLDQVCAHMKGRRRTLTLEE